MRYRVSTLLVLCTALCVSLTGAQRSYDKLCGQIAVLEKAAKAINPSGTVATISTTYPSFAYHFSAVPVAIPIKATLDCIKNITVGFQRTYDVNLMLQNMDLYLDFETSMNAQRCHCFHH